MNLPDLATKLAENSNITLRAAVDTVKLIFCLFTDALKNGDRIEIRGFGSFAIWDYQPYKGRNTMTGNEVEVKPKRLPYFKVGKELRESRNRS